MGTPEGKIEASPSGGPQGAPPGDGRKGTAISSKKRMQLELLNEIMKENPDINKLRILQTFDVDYSVKDPQSGLSVMHHGAMHGEIDLLELGLQAGLGVDDPTKLGRTPLHFACAGNQRSSIAFLLKHKADVNARTCAGLTPLHLAVREEAVAAIKALLFGREAEGLYIDVEAEDLERKTPAQMTDSKAIKDLLSRYKQTRAKALAPDQ